MKRSKRIKALFLALLLGMTILPTLPVQAGSIERVTDTTSYASDLDESVWYNGDGDITVQNGVITFPENSSSNTKMITKSAMKVATQMELMLKANFTVNFTSLPEGERFIFAIGLQSLMAESGQQGNIELAFANDGGTRKASVSAYAEDDVEEKLLQAVSCNNRSVKVVVEVSTKQSINILINGKKVYSGAIPVSGEGSLGFIQTGSCGAKVSDFVLTTYLYETPEAPNFVEDFETGFYNANLLYGKMISGTSYSPCHMKIEDYNGSKVLMFKNTGIAYIGTKYAYSNFELTFDVPYFEGKSEVDENGTIVQPASSSFGVSYGQDGINHAGTAYTGAADTFVLSRSLSGYRLRNKEPFTSDIDPKTGVPFSVRLTVIDGLVTYSLKSMQESTWREVVSYRLEEMFTGNVIIWAPTGSAATFAIDNLKVVNKDVDGKIIDVEYKSSEILVPKDFKYEPLGLDYNPKTANNDELQETWYRPVMIVAGVCLLSLGITVIASIAKTKKRKAGTNDDK